MGRLSLIPAILGLGSSLLTLGLSSCSGPKGTGYEIEESTPSEEGVGYEIFTGAYADGDGDGDGDLKGITEHIPYIQEMGIKRIWLTPIFPSPSYHGYDIRNYYGIKGALGNLEDFDELIETAHSAGIDVIIDMVLNHSSSEHEWFKQSAEDRGSGNTGEGSKADWYSWSDTEQSGFRWNDTAKAYYECRFDAGMPEFNLDNEEVRSEIESIASFWLGDHKVDGFRLDAVLYYYYDEAARNAEFLNWFKGVCRNIDPDCYIIGEAWLNSIGQLTPYMETGLDYFNFPTAEVNSGGPASALIFPEEMAEYGENIASLINRVKNASDETHLSMFLANHDTDRTSNYFGGRADQPSMKKLMASMYLLTPGNPWIYYGEEIDLWGIKGSHWNDVPRRLSMVWGNGESRAENFEGYDDSANQTTVGAYELMDTPFSLQNHYRKVISLRNNFSEAFSMKSTWEAVSLGSTSCPAWKITAEDGTEYILVHNGGSSVRSLTLPGNYSLADEVNTMEEKAVLEGTSLSLREYSTALLVA